MITKRKSYVRLLSLIGWFSLALSSARGQGLTTDQVMTAEELRATGVATLTSTQKAALNRWLNDYTLRIFKVAKSDVGSSVGRSAEYAGVGSGHWIKTVSSGGRIVTLEDRSTWEINAVDRVNTAPVASRN